MSPSTLALLSQMAWLLAYLVLIGARARFVPWLIARFHGQRHSAGHTWPTSPLHCDLPAVLAWAAALMVGAILPLATIDDAVPVWSPLRGLGSVEGSLFLVVALHWISIGLIAAQPSTGGTPTHPDRLGALLARLLQAMLALTSAALAAGALLPRSADPWRLSMLVESQKGWQGLEWLGILQPLAFAAWAASSIGPRPQSQGRPRWIEQAVGLNQALLTSVLWLGGGYGPLAWRWPWLALLYLVAKVAAVTVVQVWVWTSRPQLSARERSRSAWGVWIPLAALNLLVTAWVCAYAGGAA